jgi:ABC-type glycerol-3-phosphate transport system permease component
MGQSETRGLRWVGYWALYAVLGACAVVVLTPLVWLVAASLKGRDALFPYLFFAPRFTLYNFRELFRQMPFLRFLINSFYVAGCLVLLQLFTASLAGFALAKYEFRGKRLVMTLMLATMMIPGYVLLAPQYELIYRLGLMDSFWGLIVPGAVSVFGIFLFRQSMLGIPTDLLQAGRIDGCSEFRLYWEIALPVSRPMIGAFTLIAFMGAWNNFLWPQLVLHSRDRFVLPVALNQMLGLYTREYGALMAGTLLSILPVIVLFLMLQREFISGLTAGAIKG